MAFLVKIKNKNYNDFLTINISEKVFSDSSPTLLPFILRGWAEILENQYVYCTELGIQFSQESLPFTNNSRAIWVESADKKILGVVCYDYKEQSKCGWIHMSYTDKNERGKGINKICYKILESDCKKLGATYLSSFVSVRNKMRLDSSHAVGMIPTHYRMYKKLV